MALREECRFVVTNEEGQIFTAVQLVHVIANPDGGELLGSRRMMLADGTPLNRVDADTFEHDGVTYRRA